MVKKHAAAAAFFVLLSVAMTWPLAFAIDRLVVYPGDPYINTWILDWDWYATLHRPFKLFQANIFYPAKDSLAFSENLYGIALLLVPVRALGASPLLAHNIAMIAGYAFSGFAAYLLGVALSGSAWGGIAAGIFYAFVPWRFTQLPHVQHVWGGWVPMLLVALIHYAKAPSWRRAALLGAAFLMNGLTNVHWFLFGSIMIVLSMPVVMRRPRQWARALVAIAIALAILLPFLYPYERAARTYGMKRNWEEISASSATLHDWLNPGLTNRVYRRLADTKTNPECWLFPGILGIALSMLGFGVLITRSRSREVSGPDQIASTAQPRNLATSQPAAGGLALLWLLIGFLGSLGIHTFFYRFLFSYAPGFRAVRVPARWANIAYVGMAILIALAVAWISKNRRWAGVAAAVLLVAELRAAPIRYYATNPQVPPVFRWLDDRHVRIAELPIDAGEIEYIYMLWDTAHHRPTVNGVSGFVPPEFARISSMWNSDPVGPELIVELRRIGINLLVVHGEAIDPHHREWLRRELGRGRLSYVARFDRGTDGDWVFELRSGRSTAPELEAFLRGDATYSGSTFGLIDHPWPGVRIDKEAVFSGWALSPWGIRKIDLLFDNGQVRYPTQLLDDPGLRRRFPWYPQTPRPRFIAKFAERPKNVRPDTDVQVEITDGRGQKLLLEGRWFEWGR